MLFSIELPRILCQQILQNILLLSLDLGRQKGKFPQHLNLAPQSIAWLEEEIDAWIAARAAERSTGNSVDPVASAEQRKTENADLYIEREPAR